MDTTIKLSPSAQKLLNRLVKDTCSKLKEEERIFNKNNGAIYIYNLFIGEYDYSYKTFKELFEYLQN